MLVVVVLLLIQPLIPLNISGERGRIAGSPIRRGGGLPFPLPSEQVSHRGRVGFQGEVCAIDDIGGDDGDGDPGSSHGERNVMSGIPSSSRPRRIPPVAIYWSQVYPQECSAYSSYLPCPTITSRDGHRLRGQTWSRLRSWPGVGSRVSSVVGARGWQRSGLRGRIRSRPGRRTGATIRQLR